MPRKLVLLLFIILLMITGCVYYNTFFNAEKYFEEANTIALKDDGTPTANAIQKYNKVIQKCGVVLTDYKDSKYADDALFLMAKCFYYIGRNYTQAIKNFEELIEFYPESEFVPEAMIYIARSKYDFRQKEEAYKLLHDFLLLDEYKEYHPQALQLLANYYLEEEDYVQTDFYLQKLIEKYPKAKEYETAFFLKGKAQYDAGNYKNSNNIFVSLLKSKVSRNIKYDARYYMALNFLLMEDFQNSVDYADNLLKKEYRESEIAKIRILQARGLAELGNTEEAIAILQAVTQDNQRSKLAADAFFYLGEIYFNILLDYQSAIDNYNKVKAEFNKSELIEQALTKSAVASQIIQFHNPSSNIDAEQLVNQQFKLAEFYIETLNMPDSALMVYDIVITQKTDLIKQLDSLEAAAINLIFRIDSLKTINDSLQLELSIDTLKTLSDSLQIEEIETQPDTMKTTKEKQNSVVTLVQLQSEYNSVNLKIENQIRNLKQYDSEFIPYAKFVKLWMFKTILNDSTKAQNIFNVLQENYPGNKYTFAASSLLEGKEVELTTPLHIKELEDYQLAIEHFENDPSTSVELLLPIAQNDEHEFSKKAMYSLGYVHYFLLADSLSAKPFLDSLLTIENNDFKSSIYKFYDGTFFIKINQLPALKLQIEKEKEQEEALKEQEEQKEQKELEKSEETQKSENNEEKNKPVKP
ncbi:MAG: tetratricopeptide repeat protein [Candidatus Cloacimonetes bacterium]|nr:tetratricopeptide repeat protein [Candidatus Cloacimonadota bacterium]